LLKEGNSRAMEVFGVYCKALELSADNLAEFRGTLPNPQSFAELCGISRKTAEYAYRLMVNLKWIKELQTPSAEIRESPLKSASDTESDTEREEKLRKVAFAPPSLENVQTFITEKGLQVNPEEFWLHYQSNGWMIGKAKMKSWKAAVCKWSIKKANENPDGLDQYRGQVQTLDEINADRKFLGWAPVNEDGQVVDSLGNVVPPERITQDGKIIPDGSDDPRNDEPGPSPEEVEPF
jgi:hypothetical protein